MQVVGLYKCNMLHGMNNIKTKMCVKCIQVQRQWYQSQTINCMGVSAFFRFHSYIIFRFTGFLMSEIICYIETYVEVFRGWRLWCTNRHHAINLHLLSYVITNRSYNCWWCIHCFLNLSVDGSLCVINLCIATTRSGSSKLAISLHELSVSTGVRPLCWLSVLSTRL